MPAIAYKRIFATPLSIADISSLCTRFPTELILRRCTKSGIVVTIIPSEHRSELMQKKLQAFRSPISALENLASLFGAAEKAMGLDKEGKVFSTDILRVEVTGPKQPHLTLVDLPGLFHAGSQAQSTKDAESVKALVMSYMKKTRSIILAIVSAKNDLAMQIVTEYARKFDKHGMRTLGIITKPDILHAGSESEKSYLTLANNKNIIFHLGWHVLKNRDYDTRDSSTKERDQSEKVFSHKAYGPPYLQVT